MVQTLVADDDADTRSALRLMLEDAGYDVLESPDGVKTLDAIRASDVPLVVLLDLDMPNLDGIEVMQAVARDHRLAARHAFILLTAVSYSRYKAAEAICATLAAPLILKPFDMDTLLTVVSTMARRIGS